MEVSVTQRKCGLRTVLTWGSCPRRDSTQDRARGTDACPRSPSPVSASWGGRHVALWPRPLQWVLPSRQRDPLGTASSSPAGVALVLPPIPPIFSADVLLARLGHGVQGAPGGQACGAGKAVGPHPRYDKKVWKSCLNKGMVCPPTNLESRLGCGVEGGHRFCRGGPDGRGVVESPLEKTYFGLLGMSWNQTRKTILAAHCLFGQFPGTVLSGSERVWPA